MQCIINKLKASLTGASHVWFNFISTSSSIMNKLKGFTNRSVPRLVRFHWYIFLYSIVYIYDPWSNSPVHAGQLDHPVRIRVVHPEQRG